MKIYLASVLTHASVEFLKFTDELRLELKKTHDVLDFYGLGEGDPEKVYLHDKKCLDDCDLVVADVSHPSLGVGYEIAYALSKGKKVLAFAKEGSAVGRMIRGITDSNYSYSTYRTKEDIISEVAKNL